MDEMLFNLNKENANKKLVSLFTRLATETVDLEQQHATLLNNFRKLAEATFPAAMLKEIDTILNAHNPMSRIIHLISLKSCPKQEEKARAEMTDDYTDDPFDFILQIKELSYVKISVYDHIQQIASTLQLTEIVARLKDAVEKEQSLISILNNVITNSFYTENNPEDDNG